MLLCILWGDRLMHETVLVVRLGMLGYQSVALDL
jgi:hypothetical protein